MPCPLSVVLSSCRRTGSVRVAWLAVLGVWGLRHSMFGGRRMFFVFCFFSGVLVALSPLEDGIAQGQVSEVFSLLLR